MIYQNIFDIKELYFPILESIQEIVIFVLNAVDPIHIIENSLKINNDFLYVGDQRYQLSSFNRIVLIGLGKASQRMAV